MILSIMTFYRFFEILVFLSSLWCILISFCISNLSCFSLSHYILELKSFSFLSRTMFAMSIVCKVFANCFDALRCSNSSYFTWCSICIRSMNFSFSKIFMWNFWEGDCPYIWLITPNVNLDIWFFKPSMIY